MFHVPFQLWVYSHGFGGVDEKYLVCAKPLQA